MKFNIVRLLSSLLLCPLIRDAAYAHLNPSWPLHDVDRAEQQRHVRDSARDIWMEILLEETWIFVEGKSPAEVLRGLGPTIFDGFRFARFVTWLEEYVSTPILLTRGHA